MQHSPKEPGTAPPGIEPVGFFSGVQIRPVIIGVVIDYVATQLAMAAFIFGYVAKEVAQQGEMSEEAIAKYLQTPEGLTAMLIIGCLGTALGGFIAARRAATLHIKHGAFVGLGSLIVSFVQHAMQEPTVQLPEWFNFVSVLAVIPAGALGGYVAERLGGRGDGLPPRHLS
jgi:putative membrane protein (TIGR04086 family)